MLVKVYSGAVVGIDALKITIEVTIRAGAHFILVGLPDNAVKESKERVDSALREIGRRIPGKRVVVNMAPADLRKEGSAYDLPLALGIAMADGQIPDSIASDTIFIGELSLDGTLLPVKGILPITIFAKNNGFQRIVLPEANANEAAAVGGIAVFGFRYLKEIFDFIEDPTKVLPTQFEPELLHEKELISDLDFKDVRGQEKVKRAFEIAASGNHNILLIGPPGAGKTMLARRLPSILPPMTIEESLETTKIHSVAGVLRAGSSLISERPFRSPHHTISDVALIGGGTFARPGEISLAHNGVLFLDELPEFKRTVLEVMRQPLEDRVISINRARQSVVYPSNIMLVASMNPCMCGYYNHPTHPCTCPPGAVQKYLSRLSGPLMDRIDMHVEVIPVELDKIVSESMGEPSEAIRLRVVQARSIQTERFRGYPTIHTNAQMSPAMMKKFCSVDVRGAQLIRMAMEKYGLSARAYDRILKVARTIADLDGKEELLPQHLAEAIQYRTLDKSGWGN